MDFASLIRDDKLQALKRRLVVDGVESAHSCAHCSTFVIRPPPPVHARQERDSFFRIATSRSGIRELAKTGCLWWSLFDDQIRLLEFETEVYHAKDEIDPPTYDKWWTDEHYEALAVTLEAAERDEFLRLRRNKNVFWGFTARSDEEFESDESVIVSMRYSSLNNFTTEPVLVEARFSLPESTIIRQDGDYSSRFLALTLPDDNEDSQMFGSPINTRPGSPESFQLMRSWLETCATKHHCGILDLPTFQPSILMAVKQDSIHLVESTKTTRFRYVAFSYCWGKSAQKTMLTVANKAELLRQISFDCLDQSIQDAIRVTREACLEYLWVDALCIIQDDNEFKARELAHMNKIYQHATFTLVASRAAAVQEGFLSSREIAGLGKSNTVFEVPYVSSTKNPATRTIVLIPDQLDESEPILERAWTLQESLLSRRRLQFSTKQTTWNCQYGSAHYQDCDGWLPSQFHSYVVHGSKEVFDQATNIIWPAVGFTGPTREQIFQTWNKIVDAYTNRKLSNHTDRLPAISSIAIEFARVLDDEYICGLWKSRLFTDLLWHRMGSEDTVTYETRLPPSWSWAGCKSQVSLPFMPIEVDEDFRILGYLVQPKFPKHPYGVVEAASLRVRGLVTAIANLSNPERHQVGEKGVALDGDLDNEDEVRSKRSRLLGSFQISIDDPGLQFDHWTPDSPLWRSTEFYLLVAGYHPGSKVPGTPTGLLLTKNTAGEYLRKGIFEIQNIWGERITEFWGRDAPKPSQEEYRDRLRYLFGGESNIREITIL